MSAAGEDRIYCFGDYRFLPGRQLLLHRDQPVRIGSRALDLLRLFVERPGALIGKAELIAFTWPDTFVQEENLKVNIAALRRALAQPGSAEACIATVTGRGYRFILPVWLEQAVAPAIPPPPPPMPAAMETPAVPGVLFGRDEDIARIADMLDGRRFLTIVGPAGVGKTTAALAAAGLSARRYPDGASFIDLASIGDPQLVPAAIAAGIGLTGGLKDVLAGLVAALRGRRRLLILDNCEHVLQAVALAAEHLLAALPELAIMATSRAPLRSRAETLHRLQPLPCPAEAVVLDRDRAMDFAAVALFAARAAAVSGYRLVDADAPVIARICRRLDGLPLAIELAATRLLSCDPATLLARLERDLDALSYGPPQAPIRQQTLLATLDWSYRLLSEEEAAALRLLSVFAAAFTLEDALGVGRQLGRPPEQMLGCIEGLAGKSLLAANPTQGPPQYRLLETTRAYAVERLRGAGEQDGAARAHAAHLLAIFERAEAEWHWRVHADWIAAYGRLVHDLRRALDWALGPGGDPHLGIRLTVAALPLWDELSAVGESGRHVRCALRHVRMVGCETGLRMKLATAHAWSLTYTERFAPEGEAAWQDSLHLAERTGNVDYQLRALWGLAITQCFRARHRQVLASLERFARLAERAHDDSAAPAGERLRVTTRFYLGNLRGSYQELLRLAERYDAVALRPRLARFQVDRYVGIRVSLCLAEWVCGQPGAAAATARAALQGATEIGHVVSQANVLVLAVIPIALWSGALDLVEQQLAALALALNRQELALWEPAARFFSGMLLQERGDASALPTMRAALAEMMAVGMLVRMPCYLGMLAEAALRHGQPALARESLDMALEQLRRHEERWCEPELLRLEGRLQGHAGEAALLRAAQAATESGALTFELRAVLDLANLWLAEGRAELAESRLAAILQRFAPQAMSRDLARARQLLDRLRGATPILLSPPAGSAGLPARRPQAAVERAPRP